MDTAYFSASLSLQRLQKGLEIRLAGAKHMSSDETARSTEGSVFSTYVAQLKNDGEAEDLAVNKRWLAVSAAARSRTIRGHHTIISSLSDPEDIAFATTYCLGALLGGAEPDKQDLTAAPEEDYSILAESLLRAGYLCDRTVRDEAVSQIRNFITNAAPPRYNRLRDPFAQIAARFSSFKRQSDVKDINSLRQYLTDLKRCALHIIGPDVITALQALADPTIKLSTDQLDLIFDLFEDWGLHRPAISLLFPRLIGPYTDEASFVGGRTGEIARSLDDVSARNLRCILDPSDTDAPGLATKSGFDSMVLNGLARLAVAIRRRNAADAQAAVVEIFCIDPVLVQFLPWEDILPVVDTISLATPEAAFTTMIMGTKPVQRSSRAVAIRVGTGALIGDLTRLTQAGRELSLTTVVERFRSLPRPAASEITRTFLQPPIFERLAGASPMHMTPTEELPSQELAINLLRIEAIQNARKHRLISAAYADHEVDREREQAKLKYFQHQMRSGRVRIPWEAIEKATKYAIENIPLNFLHRQARLLHKSPLIERLARVLADELVQVVLFESTVSVDQALSNNLRHGIVIPRFLRAFDDALQIVHPDRRNLPPWEVHALRPFFGDGASALVELREFVNETLKRFVVAQLTLVPGGPLDQALRAEVSRIIREFLLKPRKSGLSLEAIIAKVTEKTLRASLFSASKALASDVKKSALRELAQVRAATRAGARDTASFLDSLETNIHEAFDEVAGWIAVAEPSDDSVPFSLDDLVKLELFSSHLANWRRFKVETVSVDERHPTTTPRLINGRYLDLFQDVIHNLVSNAFTHSGLGARTEVEIGLLVSETRLLLRCSNTISSDRSSELYSSRERLQVQARRPISAGARRDTLSGFLKMRLAFLRSLERDPQVNILPVSARRRKFTIELFLRAPPEMWHAD